MRRRKISATVDTISSLPDAIICRILSFVPTKDAVATSVLSKRWTHLWLYVPNLHFTDINVDSVESNLLFNEFVYSILVSRDAAGSNFINSFRLDIEFDNPNLLYHFGFPNITKWINLVVQRRLEYLRLHLHIDHLDDNGEDYDNDFPKLPISIFTCNTLVSLNLRWFRVEGFSFSSDGFQFPSLKTLHLESINFSGVRDFMLLLTRCPILVDLQVSHVEFPCHQDSLTLQEFKSLTFPKLRRADIAQFCCHCFPVNALSTSNFLCIHTLKVLNIVEYLYTNDHRVYQVNQLQRPYDTIPMFHNLTHLELYNRWDLVVQVLQQCPKLQNLKLNKGLCDAMTYEEGDQENWVEPEVVPQCLLSVLRSCTVQNFSDLQSEFMLEQYILKNARVLQTMTFWCKTELLPEMERKLSICSKASATCQLSVC